MERNGRWCHDQFERESMSNKHHKDFMTCDVLSNIFKTISHRAYVYDFRDFHAALTIGI